MKLLKIPTAFLLILLLFSSQTYALNIPDILTSTYQYDNASRLLSVIASGGEAISYTYDANGNRIAKEDIDTGEIITYTYNAENQLTAINYPLSTINYFYDGLGRRIEKNVAGEVTRYIYDGMDILAEFNGANELIRKYVHGPSVDEPLELRTGPSIYYYISDGLGSITALVDVSGNIVEQYRYDAFGNTTILNTSGEEISESAYGNRYMFTAREYDTETGLYYYRLRYYDPLIGRFLQEDPVGYLLGPNLYTYVGNNPINWIDPWGLYGSDVHYDKTKKWAEDVGISTTVAETIADANVGMDSPSNWAGVNPEGHALRGSNDYSGALQDAINRGDTEAFGRALHGLQDSFSHAGYYYDPKTGYWGHARDGTAPDQYDPNSKRDQWMERETRKWLKKWKENNKDK